MAWIFQQVLAIHVVPNIEFHVSAGWWLCRRCGFAFLPFLLLNPGPIYVMWPWCMKIVACQVYQVISNNSQHKQGSYIFHFYKPDRWYCVNMPLIRSIDATISIFEVYAQHTSFEHFQTGHVWWLGRMWAWKKRVSGPGKPSRATLSSKHHTRNPY